MTTEMEAVLTAGSEISTESGLKCIIETVGTGKTPKAGDKVIVHYTVLMRRENYEQIIDVVIIQILFHYIKNFHAFLYWNTTLVYSREYVLGFISRFFRDTTCIRYYCHSKWCRHTSLFTCGSFFTGLFR